MMARFATHLMSLDWSLTGECDAVIVLVEVMLLYYFNKFNNKEKNAIITM